MVRPSGQTVFRQSRQNGTTAYTFTVTLSSASNQTITVNYATADDTAIGSHNSSGDYVVTNGTVTFGIGVTSMTVNGYGEASAELDETFPGQFNRFDERGHWQWPRSRPHHQR